MKLVVGLGNIGAPYQRTRHNAGFMALDNFAFTNHFEPFVGKPKLKAEINEGEINSRRVLLVKPTTFMNRSGEALLNIKRYFNVDSKTTLIIYDDVDLDFGTVRVRRGGNSGGHNGIKSLPDPVQENSLRIRIGVANEHLSHKDTADFVLEQFTPEEQEQLPTIFKRTDQLIESFLFDQLTETTHALRDSSHAPGNF